MKALVVYHKNCWDGFCAAWLFHVAGWGDSVGYVAAQYGDAPPDCNGKRVYIVDFSYPRDVLRRIAAQCISLVVLDHHATAQQALANFDHEWAVDSGIDRTETIFDMDKSGARLTLEYLVGHGYLQPEVHPWLVDYTEDRDLWRWKLEQSKAINAAIRSYPLDFEKWDMMAARGPFEGPWLQEGQAILRREQQIIADHLAHVRKVQIAGYLVPVVNATTLFSDIAGELAAGEPFAACYFDRSDGRRQYSLHSDDNGVDVSEIAKQFGGGGHKHAAGYAVDIP